MTSVEDWPRETALQSERLSLEALRVDHAEEMAPLLDDPRLHEFTGGEPRTLAELRAAYKRRVGGGTVDGERWCNWVVRDRRSGLAVGGIQATITVEQDRFVAEVAWIEGRRALEGLRRAGAQPRPRQRVEVPIPPARSASGKR